MKKHQDDEPDLEFEWLLALTILAVLAVAIWLVYR